MANGRVGVMLDRDWAPVGLLRFARQVEGLGVDWERPSGPTATHGSPAGPNTDPPSKRKPRYF